MLLSKAYQNILFRDFKNQSTSSGEDFECGQKYGCLIQHQIIPSYYFHSHYGALATCTPLNTVPIWESIVERINIADKYLYAMAQVYNCNKRTIKYFIIPINADTVKYITIDLGIKYKPHKWFFRNTEANRKILRGISCLRTGTISRSCK